MDAGDVIALLALLVAVVSAVVSGLLGHRQTKAAEEQAKIQGDQVEVARQDATQAKRVAEDANELAEKANRLAERALAVQQDQETIDWSVKTDGQGRPIGVLLHGAHAVSDVSVRVADDYGHVVEVVADEVLPLRLVEIDVGDIWDEHVRQVMAEREGFASVSDGMFFSGHAAQAVEMRLDFVIGYRTQAGVLRSSAFEYKVSHRHRGAGFDLVEPTAG